jgi:hypothetical protein
MTSAYLNIPLRSLAEVKAAQAAQAARKSSPREDALSVLRGELDRLDAEMKAKLLQRAKVDDLIVLLARGGIAPEAALRMVKP